MMPERSELVDVEQDEAVARVLLRAKSAWSASRREDDLTRRRASEQRLIAAWPRAVPDRAAPARAFAFGVAFAACIAALVFAVQRRESANVASIESAATAHAIVAPTAPAATATAAVTATAAATATTTATALSPAPVPAPAAPEHVASIAMTPRPRAVSPPAAPAAPAASGAPQRAALPPLPPPPSVEAKNAPATPPASPSPDPRVAFTFAELEMASTDQHERAKGRARLSELMTGSDVKLAWDAATLFAQSSAIASERAAAWERYLATSPPATYRDRALLERAEALVEAGRRDEANTIAVDLRARSLPEPRRRKLERIFFGMPQR